VTRKKSDFMFKANIGKEIVWFEKVNSTNLYASKLGKDFANDGLVVASKFQTEGRGQRGNSWESNPGENLTFSILIFPRFLEVQKQFLISKFVSMGVFDVVNAIADDVSIKWPNDIYIKNCKVGGILIENSFSSEFMDSCTIGIGLNVNQQVFPDDLPNPTSLASVTGNKLEIVEVLDSILKSLNSRYQQLVDGEWEKLSEDYFRALYHKNDYYSYKANGKKFTARVVDVRESGELVLETTDGEILEFGFKEVSFGD